MVIICARFAKKIWVVHPFQGNYLKSIILYGPLQNNNVKWPNFMFSRECEPMTANFFFFFTGLTLIWCRLLQFSPWIVRLCFPSLIIHLKKLLGSDWLKRSAFLVNTVQKRVTQCRKVKHECKLQRRYPKLKRRLLEANRCISKTAEDRAKPSKDRTKASEQHTKPSEDFRRSPEHFRMFSKITRILPKFSEDCRTCPNVSEGHPNPSEDRPNTSEDLRQSPEIYKDHQIFSNLFQVLEDRRQYLLCTSVVNVWSEA